MDQFIQQALIVVLTAGCTFTTSWALNKQKVAQEMKKKLKEKDAELNHKQDEKIELLIAASVVTLRIQIIDYHSKYMTAGAMPLYAKDNLIDMYKAYHAMGGNGAMTKFYEDLIQLPER